MITGGARPHILSYYMYTRPYMYYNYLSHCVTLLSSFLLSVPEEAIYEQPPDHDDSSSDEEEPYSKIDADLSPSHLFGLGKYNDYIHVYTCTAIVVSSCI